MDANLHVEKVLCALVRRPCGRMNGKWAGDFLDTVEKIGRGVWPGVLATKLIQDGGIRGGLS